MDLIIQGIIMGYLRSKIFKVTQSNYSGGLLEIFNSCRVP